MVGIFADPEPLQFTEEEQETIVQTQLSLYRREIEQRQTWASDHEQYDAMHRGIYSARDLPWPNAADLHVQMPFWLVDSIGARQTQGIWGQTPLVGGEAREDSDMEAFRHASGYVQWALESADARAKWSMVSKTRNIHGMGVAEVDYVTTHRTYREKEQSGLPEPQFAGSELLTENDGKPVVTTPYESKIKREIKYQGPVIVGLGYDDVIAPMNGTNLQPNSPDNPHGADYVFCRQMESLSLIWSKRQDSYTAIDSNDKFNDKQDWIDAAPSQDRSTTGGYENNSRRSRQQDHHEGRQRSQVNSQTPEARPNPEFEILKCYTPWEIESVDQDGNETTEEVECIIFICVKPQLFLGAFRLSDVLWTGQRPLMELHYHRVPGRLYSMGVMEIGKHLSAELDTIHNMRVDVGFATNLPFFFYRTSSAFDPNDIELIPLKGIPVDNIGDVQFPQMQNVTSFYHQEEQLLYSLIERVFGVTDLFLGVSPTQGAAARHATGFVGTQQEALSRMSEILQQDADSFSTLCHMLYNLELQFGPDERLIRLTGDTNWTKINRQQLILQGEYDFRLGANAGMMASQIKQERAQAILTLAAQSPLINGDPGRRWEAENNYLYAIGEPNPTKYIGDKDSVQPNTPKTQSEENGEMVQFVFGEGGPAPVTPNDNDQKHLQELNEFLTSDEYAGLKFINYRAFAAHQQLHMQQMQQKQQQQAAQAAQAAGTNPEGQASQPAERPNARNVAALEGVGQMGQMGAIPSSNGNGMPQMPQGV